MICLSVDNSYEGIALKMLALESESELIKIDDTDHVGATYREELSFGKDDTFEIADLISEGYSGYTFYPTCAKTRAAARVIRKKLTSMQEKPNVAFLDTLTANTPVFRYDGDTRTSMIDCFLFPYVVSGVLRSEASYDYITYIMGKDSAKKFNIK